MGRRSILASFRQWFSFFFSSELPELWLASRRRLVHESGRNGMTCTRRTSMNGRGHDERECYWSGDWRRLTPSSLRSLIDGLMDWMMDGWIDWKLIEIDRSHYTVFHLDQEKRERKRKNLRNQEKLLKEWLDLRHQWPSTFTLDTSRSISSSLIFLSS